MGLGAEGWIFCLKICLSQICPEKGKIYLSLDCDGWYNCFISWLKAYILKFLMHSGWQQSRRQPIYLVWVGQITWNKHGKKGRRNKSRDLNLKRREGNIAKEPKQFASAESCWKVNGLENKTGDNGINFSSLKHSL